MIDVDALLQPIADETPSGEDLEYDDDYLSMEQAAQFIPEQEMGDSRIPAVEPDWRDLAPKAQAVLRRSHDLRAAQRLLGAAIRLDGLSGLQAGLTLIRGYLSDYWDTVHPQLDPDDGDPTMRVNTLLDLCDNTIVIDGIRKAPLVEVRGLGRFNLRQILIAEGELSVPEEADEETEEEQEGESGSQVPGLTAINAAFMEVDLDTLKQTFEALTTSREVVGEIENIVREQVGTEQAPDLSPLTNVIQTAERFVAEALESRGAGAASEVGLGAAGGDAAQQGAGHTVAAAPGVIASRADAVKAMDKICEYFRRNEPSSPVPLLLERAKRLIDKDFMEVIRDLAPDGLSQVEVIRGPDEDEQE